MPSALVDINVSIESNFSMVDAVIVHRLLHDLVDSLASQAEDLLRVNAPKDTGAMAAAVSKEGPVELDDLIRAVVGIPPMPVENRRYQVGTKDLFVPGEQPSAFYPLDVDQGTGIFGPTHSMIHSRRAHVMRWDDEGGAVFRRETKGQPGQHFLLKTYAEMVSVMLPADTHLFGDALKAEMFAA